MSFTIVEFRRQYTKRGVPYDVVVTAPMGENALLIQTPQRISHIRPPSDWDEDMRESAAYKVMEARWRKIGPAYEAWLNGQEIAVDGMPLEAWPAIDQATLKTLKAHGIKTVEDVRDMGEGMCRKLNIPNALSLPGVAAAFLDNRDRAVIADEKAAMEERIKALEAMLAERAEADPPKRGPGRPRKDAAA